HYAQAWVDVADPHGLVLQLEHGVQVQLTALVRRDQDVRHRRTGDQLAAVAPGHVDHHIVEARFQRLEGGGDIVVLLDQGQAWEDGIGLPVSMPARRRSLAVRVDQTHVRAGQGQAYR